MPPIASKHRHDNRNRIKMDPLVQALIFSTVAGLMIPVGGLIARQEHIRSDWLETEFRHSVIAFAGGILASAVALVLVPEGSSQVPAWAALVTFVGGGISFALLDARLAKSGKRVSQLIAMIADFVPESIALGAMFAAGASKATLLALMIGLQNLPEAFNAYREVIESGELSPKRMLAIASAIALAGPLFAAIGILFLADAPGITGGIMLFAAGGILYLIFQDIAPQAQLKNRFGPPVGAVAGFALGFAGELLL